MTIKTMFRSRKFLTAVADAVFSTVTVLVTALVAPDIAHLILIVVGFWQIPIGLAIYMWGQEDAAAKAAGRHPVQQELVIPQGDGATADDLAAWFSGQGRWRYP